MSFESLLVIMEGGDKVDKQAIIAEAWRKAKYAYNSYDMNLMYEAHGYVKGIVDSGLVTYHEVSDIDSFICRDCINNGEWVQEVERREMEVYSRIVKA